MQELRPLSFRFDLFPLISGTQSLHVALHMRPDSSPSECLGCFAVLTFSKVVCSNFGELSNAQYPLHGVRCIVFNKNLGGVPPLQALTGMSSKVLGHLQAWGKPPAGFSDFWTKQTQAPCSHQCASCWESLRAPHCAT